jgi:hypothetical protein
MAKVTPLCFRQLVQDNLNGLLEQKQREMIKWVKLDDENYFHTNSMIRHSKNYIRSL